MTWNAVEWRSEVMSDITRSEEGGYSRPGRPHVIVESSLGKVGTNDEKYASSGAAVLLNLNYTGSLC